jgi:hypothetical protein
MSIFLEKNLIIFLNVDLGFKFKHNYNILEVKLMLSFL